MGPSAWITAPEQPLVGPYGHDSSHNPLQVCLKATAASQSGTPQDRPLNEDSVGTIFALRARSCRPGCVRIVITVSDCMMTEATPDPSRRTRRACLQKRLLKQPETTTLTRGAVECFAVHTWPPGSSRWSELGTCPRPVSPCHGACCTSDSARHGL